MKAPAKLQTFTFPCCGFYAIKALALSANSVSREQQMAEPKNPLTQKNQGLTGRKTRSKNEDLSTFVYGKVPPQAIPLEEAVLGALLIDKDALTSVLDILQPESFYLDAHQLIYRAMLRLFERSQPIDLLTVTEELKKTAHLEAIGGPYYLVELTNKVASSANIEYHGRLIAQKFIQRELIRVSNDIIKNAYEDTTDVFDLLDDAEQGLFSIAEKNMSRSYDTMSSLAAKTLKQMEELKGKEDGLTGVPTGFIDLDRLTSGWQPSDLIIMAARPGMGKTSLVLSIAKNASLDYQKGVAVFSLEMASIQLAQRMISMESEVPLHKMRNGQLDEDEWKRLKEAIERISDAPVYIDDTPGINIFELRAKCRRMKLQYDIQLIIIDYLQLMSGGGEGSKGGNREQEVSAISRALKGLAKELNVPVIALSQLSRAVETRGGSKRPQLSDLRESGSIEQDADMVTFIYRPEYYQILEDEQGQSLKGIAEIIIAKNRHGAQDTVRLKFTGEFARFSNLDDPDFGSFPSDVFNNPLPTNIITMPSRFNDEEDIPF